VPIGSEVTFHAREASFEDIRGVGRGKSSWSSFRLSTSTVSFATAVPDCTTRTMARYSSPKMRLQPLILRNSTRMACSSVSPPRNKRIRKRVFRGAVQFAVALSSSYWASMDLILLLSDILVATAVESSLEKMYCGMSG